MLNLDTCRKWLFDGGTKMKQDESDLKDMEGIPYHDVLSKYSERRRRRCRKVVSSFGCALLGIVLFILFTFGYVAFTARLSHHLWMLASEHGKGGGKNWHGYGHLVTNNRQVGDGLPSITKHELPFLSSHKIDVSFRPRGPKDVHQPPERMIIDQAVLKLDRSPNSVATTDQQKQFLSAKNREHSPKNDLLDPMQKLVQERLRNSAWQVAGRSLPILRRPVRHIPVLHHLARDY